MLDVLQNAVKGIQEHCPKTIDTGIILGSGLSISESLLSQTVAIPYAQIPHFPLGKVAGHKGELLLGEITKTGRWVAIFKGRVHYYEGHSPQDVIFPVRLLHLLGAKNLIVTNAAGGLQQGMQAGDLMLIEDHLNLMGMNPLIGENIDTLGPRFPDMSKAYCPKMSQVLETVALERGITLKKGVYAAVSGPSYETPAEIRMLAKLGADAVGMSTVPEVIAAKHAGMSVLGISMISNMAAGLIEGQVLTHDDVLATGQKASKVLSKLLDAVLVDLM